jgi:hypothetical protein
LVPVQRPRKIEGKNSKKTFFGVFIPVPNTLFFGLKIFETMVVPGTQFGVEKNDFEFGPFLGLFFNRPIFVSLF